MTKRGRGWIITVCSVSSGLTQNNYTAIKAWALNYSESLAVETAGTGVTVTALVPGWVRTEFHARAGIAGTSIPDVLWLDPDDLVEECLRDVARGRTVSVPCRAGRPSSQASGSPPVGDPPTLECSHLPPERGERPPWRLIASPTTVRTWGFARTTCAIRASGFVRAWGTVRGTGRISSPRRHPVLGSAPNPGR